MSGDNRKKKGGERKDKKNARMRESVELRHDQQTKAPHHTDQVDIQTYKPGSRGDDNRQIHPNR